MTSVNLQVQRPLVNERRKGNPERCESIDAMQCGDFLKSAAAGATTVLVSVVVSLFAMLRECGEFWRNSGGWPVLLRELVLIGFYPGLFIDICSLLVFTGLVMARRKPGELGSLERSACFFLWAWFILVIMYVGANNVTNLVLNRPLHWHPPQSY